MPAKQRARAGDAGPLRNLPAGKRGRNSSTAQSPTPQAAQLTPQDYAARASCFCLEDLEAVAAWLERMAAKLHSYQANDLYHHHGDIDVPEEVYARLLDGLDRTREMLLAIAADNRARRPEGGR